ncbi:hypothetical protein ACHAWF_009483 [Thalassiosira exigua]
MITLNCPAEADGFVCDYKMKFKFARNKPVSCSNSELLQQDDFPPECMDEVYDASLYAVPGPHLFFLAKKRGTHQDNCPNNIAFETSGGNKQKLHVVGDDFEGLPVHVLGEAALKDILDAEDEAEPLFPSTYDLDTNNCIHYARRIWGTLGFKETEDLANFVISNIVDDENVLNLVVKNSQKGGRRILAEVGDGGKNALKELVEDLVYGQANIV